MSYIIAFVNFEESQTDYPAGCFRTDLSPGDAVLVRLADQRLRPGVVKALQYLNWDCKAFIECKASEATQSTDGRLTLPEGSPLHVGLATHHALARTLREDGWTPLKHHSSTYKIIYCYSNEQQTANILLRRNGVDLQILPSRLEAVPAPMSVFSVPMSEGRVVRHHLAHTTFNLFEGIYRFSRAFAADNGDYDRFFVAVGSRDKRTPELKARSHKPRNEMLDIYSAVSDGSGGPAYLGDGIWIDSGGGTHDWGR